MNGGIDLHMHTKYSDGTDSEYELIERLRKEGIKYFSVTDHDTIEGAMAVKKIVPDDMVYIPGIEFSCRTTDNGKVHILGYNCNEKDWDFRMAISEGHFMRVEKLEKRLDHLKKDHGIVFSKEEYDYLRSLTSTGKPHIAKLLIKHGYATDKKEAIENYIDDKKDPNDVTSTRIPSDDAVSGILMSGGVPVWAHPLGGINERHLTADEFDSRLKLLIGEGIKGLECWYSLYQKEEIEFLLDRAKKNGLFVSGGSDYHGRNKKVIPGELNAFGETVYKDALTVTELFNR